MKIKLGEIKSSIDGFQVLASKELNIKDAYWIGKTIQKLMSEHKIFEDTRIKLCSKHSKKDDTGKVVPALDENKNQVFDLIDPVAFQQEFNELCETEIEINFTPIPIDRLDGVKIDPMTMIKLNKFITEEIPKIEKVN
jgi:hypothetical protein